MITKAFVESKIDNFTYKVRMPIFDRVVSAPQHTGFSDLSEAIVCTPKGINGTLDVGDVVLVGFEDNTASRPIILGHLYRDQLLEDDKVYINARNITVSDAASLPLATTINDINLYQSIQKIQDLNNTVAAL